MVEDVDAAGCTGRFGGGIVVSSSLTTVFESMLWSIAISGSIELAWLLET